MTNRPRKPIENKRKTYTMEIHFKSGAMTSVEVYSMAVKRDADNRIVEMKYDVADGHILYIHLDSIAAVIQLGGAH